MSYFTSRYTLTFKLKMYDVSMRIEERKWRKRGNRIFRTLYAVKIVLGGIVMKIISGITETNLGKTKVTSFLS